MAEPTKNDGVIVTMLSSGANLSEKAMGVPLGVVRVGRDELFRVVHAGIDMLEGMNQSTFKILREMLQRVDKLSVEAVDGLEALTNALSRVIRGSGEATGAVVSQTVASFTGTKGPPREAAPAASA